MCANEGNLSSVSRRNDRESRGKYCNNGVICIKPELWYPIEGYEGWYEVSSHGRIRSVDRVVKFKNGIKRAYKGQLLKFRYHNGYAMVNLNKNKKMREFYVHRLVIENFKLHPVGKDWVNHINGKKWDNRVENLEWCTAKENNRHAVLTGLTAVNVSGLLELNRKKQKAVLLYTNDGNEIVKPSALDMAKYCVKHKFSNRDVDKLRYAIRYACQSASKCDGMHFKYVNVA